ncbi:MAG TPA: type B 50S ribosomal protein L31 [Verrucomicrobiales bacterium]|nr:type B 50S ribosomal protein L31 [Verrucomicrobiales bacterium]
MKADIHPPLHPVCFEDLNTGKRYFTRSTMRSDRKETIDGAEYFVVSCSITADSHPFYTGEKRLLDTAGRIDKFNQRYQNFRRTDKAS